jgi:16S rRNA processing protein RimM
VVSVSGEALGVVESLWNSGPVPNLVIKLGEAELMIPFAEEFVKQVDLEAGRIVVEKPSYEEG